LSVVASLALTPIVWNHYLVLLFVPLALVRPRFSAIWLGTAWVLGAAATTMRGGSLVAVIAVVWIVVLAQAEVFPQLGASRLVIRGRSAVAALSLCAALAGVLVAVLPVVPAVAALRAPGGSTAPSGAAEVRLLRHGEVCVRVVTEGVRGPASVQVSEPVANTIVLQVPLGDREACRRYPSSVKPADLAEAVAKRQVRLLLRIVSPGRGIILSGEVVRLDDARPARLNG
jgi:hypothetical protein